MNANPYGDEWRKCKACGKYISYHQMSEMKEVAYFYEPETLLSHEKEYYIHKKCLSKEYLKELQEDGTNIS